MTTRNCDGCSNNIEFNEYRDRPVKDEHLLFCSDCTDNLKLCSHSKSKRLFCLKDDDLNKLQYLYINNPTNRQKFYLYSDVENIVILKYGSIDKLKKLLKQKEEEKVIRKKDKEDRIEHRRNKLEGVCKDNKIIMKNYGDFYSYIHYGEPSIDTVIQNELKKADIKRHKMIELASELSKYGLSFDMNDKDCYNYINNLSNRSVTETVNNIRKKGDLFMVKF